jgi:hypothetical protein
MNKIKVGIIGGTGYTGIELLRLLRSHPKAEEIVVSSRSEAGQRVDEFFPSLAGQWDLVFSLPDDATLDRIIFASQGLRFGSPFSPPLADLEYILRIRALIFHWLRLPIHVSNQKTFYTKHMLSTNDLPLPVLVPMKTSFLSAKDCHMSSSYRLA